MCALLSWQNNLLLCSPNVTAVCAAADNGPNPQIVVSRSFSPVSESCQTPDSYSSCWPDGFEFDSEDL